MTTNAKPNPAHDSANLASRRRFLQTLGSAAIAAGAFPPPARAQPSGRKMTINLVGGAIGVSGNQARIIELAAKHGFESVEARPHDLARFDNNQLNDLLASMKTKGLTWGAAGLSVDFRNDEDRFRDGMKELPRLAAALERAGVNRVGTWLSPAHDTLTYIQNFNQHSRRLREIAKVLGDHGQRFGLEYVGTFDLWTGRRHPFVHSMAETADLIQSIGAENIGFVLDSWHWWTANETGEDILTLKNQQVVAVDLNDAPRNIPKREQHDNRRRLPASTGVIDIAAFLNALQSIGYDGPVRAEPFNQELNALDNDAACAETARAIRKAFELIRSGG